MSSANNEAPEAGALSWLKALSPFTGRCIEGVRARCLKGWRTRTDY